VGVGGIFIVGVGGIFIVGVGGIFIMASRKYKEVKYNSYGGDHYSHDIFEKTVSHS